MMGKEKKLFSSAMLKWIAVFSMLLDHFGAAFFILYTSYYDGSEQFAGADCVYYYILRGIGRTAFPLFCFVLVEGFCHTASRRKYLARLFLFSVLSEIPFDLALKDKVWAPESQNVFWTLLLGFAAMWLIDTVRRMEFGDAMLRASLSLIIGTGAMLSTVYLKSDYSALGVLLILIFYYFRASRIKACAVGYLSMIWEWACFPAFILIYFYNGKKGRALKFFFYLFYPVHLLLLYGLRQII